MDVTRKPGSPRRPRAPGDEGNSHSPDEEPAGRAALHASAGPAPAGGSGTFLTGALLGGNEGTEGKVFHANLARLLAASQLYMEAGRAFAQCGASLAAEMDSFATSEWGAHHCGTMLSRIATVVRDEAALRDSTMEAVRDALDVPVFQLLELEQMELRQLADAKARAEEELAHAAARNVRRKAVQPDRIVDLTSLEQSVEQRQTEYDAQSAILDGAKKIKIFRFVKAFLRANQGFLTDAGRLMAEFEPRMVELGEKLEELELAQGQRCKDGYVWKLSHKQNDKWKRVWIVLRNGWLEVRSDSEKKRKMMAHNRNKMNLLISTVKVPMIKHHGGDTEERFEFEIVTPERKRPWIFASRTEPERQEWIDALQASIEALINNQQLQGGNAADSKRAATGKDGIGRAIIRKVIPKGHRKTRSSANADSARQMAMALMQEGSESAVMAELSFVGGNDACADCGKADPEWASMNLGVVFCLNCSGIHRHLGSHITKVRSLTMDKWPLWTLRYMKCLGNARANCFWEANLNEETTPKPKPTSSQQERTVFITAKYSQRQFAPAPPESDRAALSRRLYAYLNQLSSSLTSLIGGASAGMPRASIVGHSPRRSGALASRPSSSNMRLSDSATLTMDGGSKRGSVRPVSMSDAEERPTMSSSPSSAASPSTPSPVGPPPSAVTSSESPLGDVMAEVQEARLIELVMPIYHLLAWGADLNEPEPETGRTMLQWLLHRKDPWLLHIFLVHGLETVVVDEATGDTALHYAARHNLHDCLEVLFAAQSGNIGHALRIKNLAGETVLDVAKSCQSHRTLDVMTARDTGPASNPSPESSPGASRLEAMRTGLHRRSSSELNLEAVTSAVARHGEAEANMSGERRSPRNMTSDQMGPATGGMMKKLISKATGQHHRSKSTAVSPSVSAGALPFPPRDNAVKNTLNKLRGQRHNRGTSRDTLRVKGEDGGAEDDDTASLQTWDKTPSLADSTRFGSASSLTDDGTMGRSTVDMGREVQVAGKRAPLMKSSKIAMDKQSVAAAVREAKLVESLPSQADGDGSHTPDMMAFLSEDSAESTPDEL